MTEPLAPAAAAVAAPAGAPSIDGAPATLDAAIATAAQRLARARLPLFGGLALDVAGARALYRLACATGAVCDPTDGPGWVEGLRALQDRGGFTTTWAEVRNRADIVVCLGPMGRVAARLAEQGGFGGDLVDGRSVIGIGAEGLAEALEGRTGVSVRTLPSSGSLHADAALLAAAVARRAGAAVPAAWREVADRLHSARYAVVCWDAGALPPHGALVIEMLQRAVATLNARSRAAALPLGTNPATFTVNHVFGWLSGLPLRTRLTAAGLEHEPWLHDAGRLLAAGAVDAVVWLAAFDEAPPPPATRLPLVALVRPGTPRIPGGVPQVVIPVAAAGVEVAGHVFRDDGAAVLPLAPTQPSDALPTASAVLDRLLAALAGTPANRSGPGPGPGPGADAAARSAAGPSGPATAASGGSRP